MIRILRSYLPRPDLPYRETKNAQDFLRILYVKMNVIFGLFCARDFVPKGA